MTKGTFIVLEGTDGAGKKTQAKLLARQLRRQGYSVLAIAFPRYGNASAYFVQQYLSGAYGAQKDVSPEETALFFAIDRFAAATTIREALSVGKIVVCDRYVGSNMGHHGSAFVRSARREKFFKWVQQLEFGIFSIPRPDISLVLHVPAAIAQRRAHAQRHNPSGLGKKELLAADRRHLRRAEQIFVELTKLYPRQFRLIECAPHGKLLGVSAVHDLIWQQVRELIG